MTEMTSGVGDLLQRLRTDGVEAGEREKQRIVGEAEEKARALVAQAEAQAGEIVSAAQSQVDARRRQLDAELGMAARDFAFRFAERVKRQVIEPLIQQRVTETLSTPPVLQDALLALVKERAGGATVTVSPETRSQLEAFFRHELGRAVEDGALEVRSEDGLTGFRLQRSGESFSWDVTGEAVARELSALVEPTLRRYLQIASTKA